MLVSVVVPTFRRPELLARCLEALLRQRLPADKYEVIVADDAASEETRQLVQSLASGKHCLRYVPVKGAHGPAAARNVGWKGARGQIIAFTDDDCIPDSGWLVAGAERLADPAVAAVTGQTIVPLPPRPTDHERNTAGLERSEFITANCFCRREVLAALGGFDERFTTAWREDSDLHFRLLDRGATIVRQASAVVASIVDYDRSLPLLCLPGSTLARAGADAGLRVVAEGYADRAYRGDGTLVPRGQPGAVLSDVDTVVARTVELATRGVIAAEDGTTIACAVESVCLHGDTPGAVNLARRVRDALTEAGVPLRPFS